MSDDLTHRMRTCAATIVAADGEAKMRACEDAAALLVEAAAHLSAGIAADIEGSPGEPMQLLEPMPRTGPDAAWPAPEQASADDVADFWIAPGASLPGLKHSGTVSLRPCPHCHSSTAKKVFRVDGRMMVECPLCCTRWALGAA
jgi:hypothetical protein